MVIVTYDKSITNIGNCMNIATGFFTAPITGIYYFDWTGPNGEPIMRPRNSECLVNNFATSGGWVLDNANYTERDLARSTNNQINSFNTRISLALSKDNTVSLRTAFKASLFPKQYEKFVGYFFKP